jgi:hypothetical protein
LTRNAAALPEATGVRELTDGGFAELGGNGKNATSFLSTCRRLRFWDRQAASEPAAAGGGSRRWKRTEQ